MLCAKPLVKKATVVAGRNKAGSILLCLQIERWERTNNSRRHPSPALKKISYQGVV